MQGSNDTHQPRQRQQKVNPITFTVRTPTKFFIIVDVIIVLQKSSTCTCRLLLRVLDYHVPDEILLQFKAVANYCRRYSRSRVRVLDCRQLVWVSGDGLPRMLHRRLETGPYFLRVAS